MYVCMYVCMHSCMHVCMYEASAANGQKSIPSWALASGSPFSSASFSILLPLSPLPAAACLAGGHTPNGPFGVTKGGPPVQAFAWGLPELKTYLDRRLQGVHPVRDDRLAV